MKKSRILLIEDNSGLRNNTISAYLHSHGYKRFDRTGVNDWYAQFGDKKLVNASATLKTLTLSMIVPASRHFRQLPSSSFLRKVLRRIPGVAALSRRLPF